MPEYRPAWAPHVCGTYPERESDGEGGWEPQPIELRCERCGETNRVVCARNAPRQWVVTFAYRYDALNPTFLKWMAKIGAYAAEKYGSWEQYRDGRLEGEKSPVNHIHEHLRAYVMGEPHDHFDGDVRWHLVAVAYNAMMEFFYCTKWGHVPHPLTVSEREE
jgi:hypothetical protein